MGGGVRKAGFTAGGGVGFLFPVFVRQPLVLIQVLR